MSAAARRSSVATPFEVPKSQRYASRRASLPAATAFERAVRGAPPWACADGPPGALVVSFPPEYDRPADEPPLLAASPAAGAPEHHGVDRPRASSSAASSSRAQHGHPPRQHAKRRSKALEARGVPPAGFVRMLEGHGDAPRVPSAARLHNHNEHQKNHHGTSAGVDTDDDTTTTDTNNSAPASAASSEAPSSPSDAPHPHSICVEEAEQLTRDEFSRRLSLFASN
jgi:hypothetical protein